MHRILIVEDNADDAILIQRAFHGNDFQFEAVTRAEDAVKKLIRAPSAKNSSELPSLILLDLSLPGMGGFELIRALKEHPPTAKIPVVILTASDREEDVAQGYKWGAVKFLRKPLTPLLVGEIINDCLEK